MLLHQAQQRLSGTKRESFKEMSILIYASTEGASWRVETSVRVLADRSSVLLPTGRGTGACLNVLPGPRLDASAHMEDGASRDECTGPCGQIALSLPSEEVPRIRVKQRWPSIKQLLQS